jgi:hypothetical protein
LTNSELISAKAQAVAVDVRRQGLLLSLICLAAGLRIYQISLYPIAGDEYNSLAGAHSITLNWNSIIYATLTHFWIQLGTSEFWLRLPAAIFGIATIPIVFKIGEKLGGWRTAAVVGLLAATSPFNIQHSQEMRFYSLFICASAAFMLATIYYVDGEKTISKRVMVLGAGAFLLLSHFLGMLALCAQVAATVPAGKSRRFRRIRVSALICLLILMGLPLVPAVQQKLWQFYSSHAGVTDFSQPVISGISTINFAKVALAGYTFVFGYHVYPLRLILVAGGLLVTVLLLCLGVFRLWKGSRWKMLPLMYLISLIAVFFVLNSIGGHVATVIGPRHAAFVWPAFIVLSAIGLASLPKPFFQVVLAAVLAINAISIWSGWQKDWTYGVTTDYRSAAEQASRWIVKDTALIYDGRAADSVNYYYPKSIPLIYSWPYLQKPDLVDEINYQRLIFVTNDWEPGRRPGFDQLMGRLNERYSVIDGQVDYPLFQYALDRKPASDTPGYALRPETNQVLQPISFYGLEFQDLRLPVSVRVSNVPLTVIGAYGLPDFEGRRELNLPLSVPVNTRRVIFLSDILGARALQYGQVVAEILVESKSGKTMTLPLRFGKETTAWNQQCEPTALCQTVFQWHKLMAIAGQNAYDGALRDFTAGLHGVALELPEQQEVVRLTIRYAANAGRLYVWGVALPGSQVQNPER